MKLSPRLRSIADMVTKNVYVADIGTDHAYIPIYLVKNKICSRAIATDVKQGPLLKAEKNIRMYGLKDNIELRRGYGLSPIAKGEIDCAILAGMGGYLICDILENDAQVAACVRSFIIQPMQAPEAVRMYLYKHNYKVYDEMLVKENDKIYEIIAAEHGTDCIDDGIYFEIGKKLIEKKDPLLRELILSKIGELNNVINKIDNKESLNAQNRIEECQSMLEKYKEVLKCL